MIELDDAKDRLDVDLVTKWLSASYWTPGIGREQVGAQIAGSHCIGAYREGRQIGFTRAITDYASFAWIADVWVDEAARGAGLGRRMVQWFLDHPRYRTIRRFALVTGDAHGVYEKLGFHTPLRPERWMERLSGAFAAQLKDMQ